MSDVRAAGRVGIRRSRRALAGHVSVHTVHSNT